MNPPSFFPIRLFFVVLLAVVFSIGNPASLTASDDAATPPNVIFILCDDLGWGDLGVLHQNQRSTDKKFATPMLDQMANEGAQLRNHYCPAPVCAPSRASLLLGVHQGHCEIRDNQFDKQLPDNHTVATVMKSAGYKTGLIGKYGLQGDKRYAMKKDGTGPDTWPAYPTKRGFDEFFGYVRHVDGHVHYPADRWELGNSESHKSPKELWHQDGEISRSLSKCYTTDLFTAYAKHWINEQSKSDSPFFLYLAYDTPHAALQVPSAPYPDGSGLNGGVQWLDENGKMINTATGEIDSYRYPELTGQGWTDVEERFATMVRRIDDCVGDLLQTLRDLDIDQNTLVVLSSDNGPHHESYLDKLNYNPTSFESYGPFDGTKRDTWEGGIRVPTLAWWPGTIPGGTIDKSPSQFHDWMATFADVAGVSTPMRCDGVSVLPTMTGLPKRTPSRVYVEYNQNGATREYEDFEPRKRKQKRKQMQVIFVDGYKGIRVDISKANQPFEIYDLEKDPSELTNLAGSSPAMDDLQTKMLASVTQLRRPNASAPRPYDDAPIASIDSSSKPQTGAPSLTQGENRSSWVGYIEVEREDTYQFEFQCDQPSIVRLHEALLFDNDYRHTAGQKLKTTAKLAPGFHRIEIMSSGSGNAAWDLKAFPHAEPTRDIVAESWAAQAQ